MDVDRLIGLIVDCAITVKKTLGEGFLEAVYQNALIYELEDNGLKCEKEKPVTIFYKGRPAGNYRADIIVEAFDNPVCKAQLVNNILSKTDKYIVASSGMAGYASSNNIKTSNKL